MDSAGSEKIVLDAASFKALSSDTRVSILKKLNERRMTASELAEFLAISVQAVSTHLTTMEEAGLVKRLESHRKWVYYELTEKGLNIVNPGRKAFLVVLSVLALFAVALGALVYTQLTASPLGSSIASQQSLPGIVERSSQPPVIAAVSDNSVLIAEKTSGTAQSSSDSTGGTTQRTADSAVGTIQSSSASKTIASKELALPDGTLLSLEIAGTQQQRITGLSNRNELCSNCGMLFVFDSAAKYGFWMRDTLMPLDMIFLDENYAVVDVNQNAQPCGGGYCPLFYPEKNARYVLELNAGFAGTHDLNKGVVVDLKKIV